MIPVDCDWLMFTFGTARKLTSTANMTVDWEGSGYEAEW